MRRWIVGAAALFLSCSTASGGQQPLGCDEHSSSDAALLTAAWTPVLLAAARRQIGCLQLLLSAREDSDGAYLALQERSPDQGKNVLHLSAELGSASQLTAALAHVECSTRSACITIAWRFGATSSQLTVVLCGSGRKLLRVQDTEGNTVLHTVARRGHPQMMQYLLHHCGYDVSHGQWMNSWLQEGDANNETAVHLAARHGHMHVVTELLKAADTAGLPAASLMLRGDRLGGTALHSAVSKRRHGVIQSILTYFLRLDDCTHRTVQLILEHRNINGRGALNLAAAIERDPLAVLLLLRARGLTDWQGWQCSLQKADLGEQIPNEERSRGSELSVALEADVHLALRWAALTQPEGWQVVLATGVMPLIDLLDCEGRSNPYQSQFQYATGSDLSAPSSSFSRVCLLQSRVDFGSEGADTLPAIPVDVENQALMVSAMKAQAAGTCFRLNGRGHNILHVVAAEGNADSLRLLLDLCADDFWPSSTVLSAMSSFAVAAANAVLATATTLVPFSSSYGWMGHGQENCKIAAETHDHIGASLLHHAAAHGAHANARYLLAACNADPTLLDRRQRSAAHYAVDAGHAQLAELLLRYSY